jgi:hypothetical protein
MRSFKALGIGLLACVAVAVIFASVGPPLAANAAMISAASTSTDITTTPIGAGLLPVTVINVREDVANTTPNLRTSATPTALDPGGGNSADAKIAMNAKSSSPAATLHLRL